MHERTDKRWEDKTNTVWTYQRTDNAKRCWLIVRMHLHTESLGKTRQVKCERANSVWRNVENARLINRWTYFRTEKRCEDKTNIIRTTLRREKRCMGRESKYCTHRRTGRGGGLQPPQSRKFSGKTLVIRAKALGIKYLLIKTFIYLLILYID